jgi:hypothetical protein
MGHDHGDVIALRTIADIQNAFARDKSGQETVRKVL